ncbi:MAG: GAF domain-containing protein [Bacteroidales bacterium]|jgi:GAF domain-containing protein
MPDTKKKIVRYERLFEQLQSLLSDSPDLIAQLSTINSILYYKISYIFWVGFYLYKDNELTVGPYQGPLACQKLPYGKGVCWRSVLHKKPVIVDNVNEFRDHIACDSRAKSEIVVPVFDSGNNIVAVLDADSDKYQAFDTADETGLSKVVQLIKI